MAKLIFYEDFMKERVVKFKLSKQESKIFQVDEEYILAPLHNNIRIDVIERGTNESTQYLKIPLGIRRDLKLKPGKPIKGSMLNIGKKKYIVLELK